jgi:hypothetical protein
MATKFFGCNNLSSSSFYIHLYGKAIVATGESVIGLGEDNSILAATKKYIIGFGDDFNSVFDKEPTPL